MQFQYYQHVIGYASYTPKWVTETYFVNIHNSVSYIYIFLKKLKYLLPTITVKIKTLKLFSKNIFVIMSVIQFWHFPDLKIK